MHSSRYDRVFLFVLVSLLPAAMLPTTVSAQLAEGHDKYLGSILGSATAPASFLTYWDQVTPENAGKWGSAEPSRDNMNWAQLDAIYTFAKNNGLPFRWHAFIWGQQYPGWIENLPEDEQREEVEEWIQLVSQRYPDVDFIDVVNEPLHEFPVFGDALGGSGETGWDWVIWAFEKAREYFPDAELHVNDYNVVGNSGATTTYLQIIGLLQERGLIDGIGEQGHFMESTSLGTIRSNLNRLAATGLPIHITEFDLNIADDGAHRARWRELFPEFWEHESVAGVTLWGYIQGRVWRTDSYMVRTNGSERPALRWLRGYLAGHHLAVSQTTTSATVTGSLQDTQVSDNVYQSLREIEPEGTDPGSYSILEHMWTVNVPPGEQATFHVEAYREPNAEGDNFIFSYSVDGTTFTPMVTVSSTQDTDETLSYVLPAGTEGPVQIRVQDADRTFGNASLQRLFVDHLYVQVGSATGTAVEERARPPEQQIPASIRLQQNYPNPFNPATTIGWTQERSEHVRVSVFDATGRLVLRPVDAYRSAGEHRILFEATGLPSGVYLYEVSTPSYTARRKMILAK